MSGGLDVMGLGVTRDKSFMDFCFSPPPPFFFCCPYQVASVSRWQNGFIQRAISYQQSKFHTPKLAFAAPGIQPSYEINNSSVCLFSLSIRE
jgi:hypothetical protein